MSNTVEPDLSRFPADILSPGAPYVYFMSLNESEAGSYILSNVSGYFSGSLSSEQSISDQNIDDAFTFLDTVIASEYSKEMNFLEYLKNQTKDIKNFKIPALTGGWNTFVKEMQDALGGGENALDAMENELKRLEQQNERRGNKKNISGAYEQDQITKLTSYANMLTKFIDNRNQSDITKQLSSQIYGLILSKFGSRLININGSGQLEFNRSQLLGLMNTISNIVLHDYVIKNSLDSNNKYKQFNDSNENFDMKKLEEILNSDEISNRVDSLITKANVLPFLTDDMAENLGLVKETKDETFDPQALKLLASNINNTSSCENRLEKIGLLFQNLYSGYQVPESAIQITSNGNAYAEVTSSINALGRGANGVFNTGSAGAKPDNILGFITISIDELLALKGKDKKQYDDAISELTSIHTELKKLSGGFKSTNTLDYYNKQKKEWNKSVENIKQSLNRLRKKYKLLGNCFIIEDSTKNYISLYGKTINNKLMDAMHGGSLGPNVTDQINKIQNLANAGGISFPDAQWLISVIINSGPGMVASGQKNQLEEYLAKFATILLFDDQVNIVREAYRDLGKQLSGGASVEKIHLFSVNDGYYPLSFVLQRTKEALQKNYQNAKSYVSTSGGAEVEISGYVKEPQEAYKKKKAANQWIATRQAALGQTKVHITFLVGFMGVLNQLFSPV